jgi:hypothetical protein
VIDQKWNRKEAEVHFPLEDNSTYVSFDEETGYLLSAEKFSTGGTGGSLMSDEQALSAAEDFYAKLPYPEGYVYTGAEKLDDSAWMFCFAREVIVTVGDETMTLKNDYEQVRITVDPHDGSFVLSNTFYVPLLDDHQKNDAPLGKDEAIEAAKKALALNLSLPKEYTASAEIRIIHPNYVYTQYESSGAGDLRYSAVTRLGWSVEFSYKTSIGTSKRTVCVDLYTGEILGGDETK